MIFYIEQKKQKCNTAGAKAPDDIEELCRKRGYKKVEFAQFPRGKRKLYQRIWIQTVGNWQWNQLYQAMSKGDIVIYQHPSYGKRTALTWIKRLHRKGCKAIALIHDLESLRGGIEGIINTTKTTKMGDNELLSSFDAVICHNEHMRQYLIQKGFDEGKLVNLEIFDYLSDCELQKPVKGEKPSIVIAGNLAIGKCAYIYKIVDESHNRDLTVNLFGIRFEKEKATAQLSYHGSYKPEELPAYLIGDFGLVWDGPEAATCAGNTGEYLKYNNPHKTSLYLSSGLPVIVWSRAAIADFVRNNRVGITVNSLYELEDKIGSISREEYDEMCTRVSILSDRLHNGYYFYAALDQCLQKLKDS